MSRHITPHTKFVVDRVPPRGGPLFYEKSEEQQVGREGFGRPIDFKGSLQVEGLTGISIGSS